MSLHVHLIKVYSHVRLTIHGVHFWQTCRHKFGTFSLLGLSAICTNIFHDFVSQITFSDKGQCKKTFQFFFIHLNNASVYELIAKTYIYRLGVIEIKRNIRTELISEKLFILKRVFSFKTRLFLMYTNSKINKHKKSLSFIFPQKPFIFAHLLTCTIGKFYMQTNVSHWCILCHVGLYKQKLYFFSISKFKYRKLIRTNEYFQ